MQLTQKILTRAAGAATIATLVLATMTVVQAGSYKDSGMTAKKDIVDTAVAAGSFSTLAAALEAAGLVDALKGDGPYTVFAPTDEAFSKLPEGTLQNLLKPENKDQLTAILLYHVVPGEIMSGDINGQANPETLEGQTVAVSADGMGVTVGGAKVVQADVKASNGVIHVVDSVILPPAAS